MNDRSVGTFVNTQIYHTGKKVKCRQKMNLHKCIQSPSYLVKQHVDTPRNSLTLIKYERKEVARDWIIRENKIFYSIKSFARVQVRYIHACLVIIDL